MPLPSELKALVFTKAGKTELKTFPMSSVEPDEVAVRTIYTMVSTGTEMRVFSGKGEATDQFPLVPGYIVIGEVVEVGSKVKGFRVGDMVSARNSDKPLPGVQSVYGGQRSYNVYPQTGYIQPILLPQGADPLDYVIAEPASISGRGVQMAAPQPDEIAVVIGQGLIGALSAAWLAAAGCRVVVVDIHDSRLARAAGWGVSHTINGKEDVEARFKALCPGGADIVVEASASPAGYNLACALLRKEDHSVIRDPAWPRLIIQASHSGPLELKLPGEGALVFMPGDRRPADRALAVEAIRSGIIPAEAFRDQVVPVEDAPDAYLRLRDKPNEVFSLVFDWQELTG